MGRILFKNPKSNAEVKNDELKFSVQQMAP